MIQRRHGTTSNIVSGCGRDQMTPYCVDHGVARPRRQFWRLLPAKTSPEVRMPPRPRRPRVEGARNVDQHGKADYLGTVVANSLEQV